jgi:hypothetical protein
MQASFDGVFPDTPVFNLGSGLSRIHVVTFSLFNFVNAASYYFRNSQCKFRVKSVEGLKRQAPRCFQWVKKEDRGKSGTHELMKRNGGK